MTVAELRAYLATLDPSADSLPVGVYESGDASVGIWDYSAEIQRAAISYDEDGNATDLTMYAVS